MPDWDKKQTQSHGQRFLKFLWSEEERNIEGLKGLTGWEGAAWGKKMEQGRLTKLQDTLKEIG